MLSFSEFLIERASTGSLMDDLKNVLPSTDPRKSGFLFPDGELKTFTDIYAIHQDFAEMAGSTLSVMMGAGVARYVPSEGVSIATALTFAQAETLKSLWDSYFRNYGFHVDIVDLISDRVKATKNFGESDDWTADTIRNWTVGHV